MKYNIRKLEDVTSEEKDNFIKFLLPYHQDPIPKEYESIAIAYEYIPWDLYGEIKNLYILGSHIELESGNFAKVEIYYYNNNWHDWEENIDICIRPFTRSLYGNTYSENVITINVTPDDVKTWVWHGWEKQKPELIEETEFKIKKKQ